MMRRKIIPKSEGVECGAVRMCDVVSRGVVLTVKLIVLTANKQISWILVGVGCAFFLMGIFGIKAARDRHLGRL
jgi:hypothetical protein